MSISVNTRLIIRCCQSLLILIVVSICLFILSIFTFLIIRRQFMPIEHLSLPIKFGLPSTFNREQSIPSYVVSSINLTDSFDLSIYPYQVEIHCNSPRSYMNRQHGSFYFQMKLISATNEFIIHEQSRLFHLPYQSDLVRIVRTLIYLPLALLSFDFDRWILNEILIDRLKSKYSLDFIEITLLPSTFQLEQCVLHFHLTNLTGFIYYFTYYPFVTSCLSIILIFSVYMSVYLFLTGVSIVYQMIKNNKQHSN